jgi:hypothetical protein
MKAILALLAHLMVTVATLFGLGRGNAVIAQNLLLKQQPLMLQRRRQRAPNLGTCQRLLLGVWL